jgi:predicted deacylase
MKIPDAQSVSLTKDWLEVLELADGTPVRLPILTAKGIGPGPKLVLTGAVHGWEIVGTEVIRRVLQEKLVMDCLTGTVIAIPVANPLAFQVKSYITPHDNVDIGSAMPGDPSGTQSRRIANKLWEIIQGSSCYVDLHCMEGPSIPLTIVRGPETGPVVKKTLEIAAAFGLPITRPSPETLKRRPNTAADLAISQGIPAIIPELPFPSIFMNDNSVEIGVMGVLNVMKYLKMIPGEPERQKGAMDFGGAIHTTMISSNRGGIAHAACQLGARVSKGDVLVRLMNVFGEEVELIQSPRDGFVISFPLNVNQVAGSGDFVVLLGYR